MVILFTSPLSLVQLLAYTGSIIFCMALTIYKIQQKEKALKKLEEEFFSNIRSKTHQNTKTKQMVVEQVNNAYQKVFGTRNVNLAYAESDDVKSKIPMIQHTSRGVMIIQPQGYWSENRPMEAYQDILFALLCSKFNIQTKQIILPYSNALAAITLLSLYIFGVSPLWAVGFAFALIMLLNNHVLIRSYRQIDTLLAQEGCATAHIRRWKNGRPPSLKETIYAFLKYGDLPFSFYRHVRIIERIQSKNEKT